MNTQVKRNGLVLAAGIIAVVRGALQLFSGLAMQIESQLAYLKYLEIAAAAALVAVGIFAIVKSASPSAHGAFSGIGFGVIAWAVINSVLVFIGYSSLGFAAGQIIPALVGSAVVLVLIGLLLITGAKNLS